MMDRVNAMIMSIWSRGLQLREEEGQGAVEYVLILVAVVAAVAVFTTAFTSQFDALVKTLKIS